MKPINFTSSTCESKSANCVIWPGPDIDCISLKKGQTVSWAIWQLATKLCELEAQMDITALNLTNMEAQVGPITSFSQMLQLLIDRTFPLIEVS